MSDLMLPFPTGEFDQTPKWQDHNCVIERFDGVNINNKLYIDDCDYSAINKPYQTQAELMCKLLEGVDGKIKWVENVGRRCSVGGSTTGWITGRR